jgi:hypothetical protein
MHVQPKDKHLGCCELSLKQRIQSSDTVGPGDSLDFLFSIKRRTIKQLRSPSRMFLKEIGFIQDRYL